MTSASPRSLVNLIERASDPSPAARAHIIEEIGALVAAPDNAGRVREMSIAADILRRLLRDAELSVRRRLAERLAREPAAPPALVLDLAKDEAEVARPILIESAALADADLMEVIAQKTAQHRLAITLRREISREISASLIDSGEVDVARSLLDNPGARFFPASLAALVERSRAEAELREPLLHRGELDPALAGRMYGWVSEALRRHIVRNFDVDPALIDAAIRDSLTATAADHQRIHATHAGAGPTDGALDRAYAEDTTILIKLLRVGEVQLFEAMFARVTRLAPRLARRALYEPGGRALAVACRATGIDKPIFAAIFLLARRARPGDKTVDPAELPAVLAFFDTLDAATATRTLAHLRVAAERRRVN
jgi:uncharacterized protein (DUF2336 family)